MCCIGIVRMVVDNFRRNAHLIPSPAGVESHRLCHLRCSDGNVVPPPMMLKVVEFREIRLEAANYQRQSFPNCIVTQAPKGTPSPHRQDLPDSQPRPQILQLIAFGPPSRHAHRLAAPPFVISLPSSELATPHLVELKAYSNPPAIAVPSPPEPGHPFVGLFHRPAQFRLQFHPLTT
jgi:hypothetical protein